MAPVEPMLTDVPGPLPGDSGCSALLPDDAGTGLEAGCAAPVVLPAPSSCWLGVIVCVMCEPNSETMMLAALLLEGFGGGAGETLTVTTADELSTAAALDKGSDAVLGTLVAAFSTWDSGNGGFDCSGDDAGDAGEGALWDTLTLLDCAELWTLAELVACAGSGVCGGIDEVEPAVIGSTSTEDEEDV